MTIKDVIETILEDPVEAILSLIIWLGIFAVVPFTVLVRVNGPNGPSNQGKDNRDDNCNARD